MIWYDFVSQTRPIRDGRCLISRRFPCWTLCTGERASPRSGTPSHQLDGLLITRPPHLCAMLQNTCSAMIQTLESISIHITPGESPAIPHPLDVTVLACSGMDETRHSNPQRAKAKRRQTSTHIRPTLFLQECGVTPPERRARRAPLTRPQ